MKKLISVLILGMMCLCLVGCGEKKSKLELGKEFFVVGDGWEGNVIINGARKTYLMAGFSSNRSQTEEIVMLDMEIQPTKIAESGFDDICSYDTWKNIRLSDEDGTEVPYFEYSLPGDETSIVFAKVGEKVSCTIPYALPKGERYVEVDIYQDTEYSNKIKVNIE